jgi:uncharacterized protein YkwD
MTLGLLALFYWSDLPAPVAADSPERLPQFIQPDLTPTPEPIVTPEPAPAPVSDSTTPSEESNPPSPATEPVIEPTPTSEVVEPEAESLPVATAEYEAAELEPTPEPAADQSEAADGQQYHAVQEGEILWNIARDYATTAEAIMEVNGISDPRSLQIGQKLLIPNGDTPGSLAAPIQPMSVYEIRQGDTLLALANEYGITLNALQAANPGLEPTRLQIGQQLLIPSSSSSNTPVARKIMEYTIQPGDTLLALAIQYGSDVDNILANNPGLQPTLLQIGQEITIPLDGSGGATVRTGASAASQLHGADVVAANITSLEDGMIAAINGQRAEQGLTAYAVDETLTAVAEAHAYDMVSRGYFSHVTPEGETLRGRLQEAGVELHWVGENIQRNTQPADRSVGTAISWFMGSRAHRNNILHGHYNKVGVGVVEGPPGWYTFVLIFAER